MLAFPVQASELALPHPVLSVELMGSSWAAAAIGSTHSETFRAHRSSAGAHSFAL